MAFYVLIVEDKPDLSGLLYGHLLEAFNEGAHQGWPVNWPVDADKHLRVKVLSKEELQAIRKLKSVGAIKRRLEARDNPPDAIITDLALSKGEVKKLDKQGGRDRTGAKDPTKELERTTGFRILSAMASTVPVIATTYANNPRVFEACWLAGAHAVIPKPASDEQMSVYFDHWRMRKNPHADLSKSQKQKAKRWGRRIEAYLQGATHEVLKGVRAQSLSRMESLVPRRLPYWLTLDGDRLEGRRIEGTSLMLVEVEGVSRLTTFGKRKPEALFGMMNEIWRQVHPLLEGSDAEINHFSGDAALVFRGVYDEEEVPSQLQDILECGTAIARLFLFNSPLRKRLVEMIDEAYPPTPRQPVERIKEHIEGGGSRTPLNVRVISIQLPAEDALYGRIGADARWQHSTLSKYLHRLKAAKEVLDEAERPTQALQTEGESFLIAPKTEPPAVPGFEIEALETLLEEGDEVPERPQLKGHEVHRVVKAIDRALVS